MKKVTIILTAILMVVMVSNLAWVKPDKVMAGMSELTMVAPDDIENGQFSNSSLRVNGNVKAVNNKAVFGNSENNEEDKLIIKSAVHNFKDYNVENLFFGKATIDIALLKGSDNSFSFMFGVRKINGNIGIENSVELCFKQGVYNGEEDGISFGIYEYVKGEDGVLKKVIKEQKMVAGLYQGKPFVLKVHAKSNGQLSVGFLEEDGKIIKNYPIYHFDSEGTGFMGFYGKGEKAVNVYNIDMKAYSYDIADNVDFVETFSHNGEDCYNKNLVYTQSKAGPQTPTNLSAENGRLNFVNATSAYLTTRYQYSNFEMEMDIPYFQRNADFVDGFTPEGKSDDEISKNVKTPITSWFGIAFGVTSFYENVDLTPRYSKYLLFEGVPYGDRYKRWEEYSNPMYHLHLSYDSYYNIKSSSMKKNSAGEKGINLWSTEYDNDQSITIKFSVIDGVVTMYAKLTESESYGKPQFQFDMGYTPTGYIRIFCCADDYVQKGGMGHTMSANMSIDNLKVTNMDMNKSFIKEPDFEKNTRPKTNDYTYHDNTDSQDMKHIFAEKEVEKSNGCGSSVNGENGLIPLISIMIFALFVSLRRNNR